MPGFDFKMGTILYLLIRRKIVDIAYAADRKGEILWIRNYSSQHSGKDHAQRSRCERQSWVCVFHVGRNNSLRNLWIHVLRKRIRINLDLSLFQFRMLDAQVRRIPEQSELAGWFPWGPPSARDQPAVFHDAHSCADILRPTFSVLSDHGQSFIIGDRWTGPAVEIGKGESGRMHALKQKQAGRPALFLET